MPELSDLVDVEAVLIGHVAVDADVIAAGAATASDLPAGFPSEGEPFVQLFRVTSTDQGSGHVERVVVQLNAYGGSKAEAFDVFRVALLALRRAPAATFVGAVVTDVLRLNGPTWSPDPLSGAPRYTGSVAVTVHPA